MWNDGAGKVTVRRTSNEAKFFLKNRILKESIDRKISHESASIECNNAIHRAMKKVQIMARNE